MKKNTFSEIIKPVLVLACICLVVTALLAYVNSVTAPIIKAADEKAAAEARSEVLSEADGFDEITNVNFSDEIAEAYKATNGAGYTFTVSEKGYGGEVRIMFGITKDGSIEKCKTLNHSETSGIGSRVVDNDSGYRDKFFGKTVDNYDEVDAISGATISSKAYKKAIAAAFAAYETAKEAE